MEISKLVRVSRAPGPIAPFRVIDFRVMVCHLGVRRDSGRNARRMWHDEDGSRGNTAGPYFHDDSAATLADVVAHYNRVRGLGLTGEQQRELVEHLKSL